MSLLDTDQVGISDRLQMISQWHEVKTFAAEHALKIDASPNFCYINETESVKRKALLDAV